MLDESTGQCDSNAVEIKGSRWVVVVMNVVQVTGCIKEFSEAENYNENGIKTTNFINQNMGLENCNES